MNTQCKNVKNFEIYNYSETYNPKTISVMPEDVVDSYAQRQLVDKLNILKKYISAHKVVADFGCANGRHLVNLSKHIKQGIGVDFSSRFIDYAISEAEKQNIYNLRFLKAPFETSGLENSSIDLLFSLSSLYYVLENIEQVFNEISRILKPNGIAILDLGNARSLMKIVSKFNNETSKIGPYNIDFLVKQLKLNFDVVECRSYQIFPMWGNKPWYLKPFLNRLLPVLLKIRLRGKMLDELISSLPFIRKFAFRHILVLKRK